MVLEIGWMTFLAIGLSVAIGAFVQSVVGLGLGLVAAPLVTLLAPDLMPGSMLLVVTVLPLATLTREHQDIDWHGLSWAFPARVFGSAVGVWVVLSADDRQLSLAIGVVVLLAVVLTAFTVTVPVNRRTLSTAGFLSGITGTASSIGGPPFALLYQHRPPRQIRTTLATYFIGGSILSLVGLGLAGGITADEWKLAAGLIPWLALGFALSGPMRSRVSPEIVRPMVLLLSAASALALIVRAVLG